MKTEYQLPKEKLTEFCRDHHIKKLSVFGSFLRDDFGPESDIDLLAEFDPDYIPGLLRLAGMETELSRILGRRADIQTPEDLSPYFRNRVLHLAEVQYETG
ncbi:MAG: nucleotidyltransferase family protein [Desulfobacterales bacterium]